jgi:hypothetical protein
MTQEKGIFSPLSLLMATVVCLPLLSHAQDNPFEFKEKRPVVQAPTQKVVKQDPNLSQEQRMQVADMIKKTLSSMEIKDEGSKTVIIDEREYVILNEDESLKGVTSGLFAVYSEKTMDFEFYDTQKYARVISMEEYKQLKLNAQQKVGLVLDSIRKGVAKFSGVDSQFEPVSRSSSLNGQLEPISKISGVDSQFEPVSRSSSLNGQLEPISKISGVNSQLEPISKNSGVEIQLEPISKNSGVEIQFEPISENSGVEIQLEPVSNGSGLAPIEID